MKKLLFLLFTGSLVGSCIPDEDVPIEPAITFKEYRFSQEDLGGVPTDFFYITFEYIDGDGDIGMNEDEDHIPGHPDVKHNLFVDYYEERDDSFITGVECAIGGKIETKKYYFKSITPEGNNKSIQGEMTVKVETCEGARDTTKNIKYSFYIVDRKLNYSNVEETPVIPYTIQK